MSDSAPNRADLNRAHRRETAHDQRRGVDTDDPNYFPTVEPIVVRPLTACQMLDCGITRLYELVNEGELDSFTDGRRRYIVVESIHRYIANRLATGNKMLAGFTERAVAASVRARKAAPKAQTVPSAVKSPRKTRTLKRKLTSPHA